MAVLFPPVLVADQPASLSQDILSKALGLSVCLARMDSTSLNREAVDSLAILRRELSRCFERVAPEAAYLSAALLDPCLGNAAETLPAEARELVGSLVDDLAQIGAMEPYDMGGGRFGVWELELVIE